MITPGGEVAFVGRLITESRSATLQRKIQWFSAMLGKLSSVNEIVAVLRKVECANYAVAEFIQGQRTRRWCVAWSWMGFRPTAAVARYLGSGSGVEKKLLPALTEVEFEVDGTAEGVGTKVDQEMGKLELLWKHDPRRGMGMLMSRRGDVWSRKARRKKLHEQQQPLRTGNEEGRRNEDQEMKDSTTVSGRDGDDSDEDEDEEPEPALVARISLSPSPLSLSSSGGRLASGKTRVHIRHLQGHDSILFESFCGWIKRKISS